MRLHRTGSLWNRNNRNGINNNWERLEGVMNSIQDMVIKGQLTPTQYAELLQELNGLISKGQVSVHDIDKNKGLLDQSFLSPELLKQIAGTAPILSTLADGVVTNAKLAGKAVSPDKTTFFNSTANLFDGEYKDGMLISDSYGSILRPVYNYDSYKGKVAVIPIEPGKTYSVVADRTNSNVFRIGVHHSSNPFGTLPTTNSLSRTIFNTNASQGTQNDPTSSVTFSAQDNERYLFVYVANNGVNVPLQVFESTINEDYIPQITPEKTTFFQLGDGSNLFDGKYHNGILFYSLRSEGDTLFLRNDYDGYKGKTAIVEVEANTTYTAKVHGKVTNDVFRIGLMDSVPSFADSNLINHTADTFVTQQRTKDKEHTFTTGPNTRFALIYVSNDGTEPQLMVNKGSNSLPFAKGAQIGQQHLPPITPELTSFFTEGTGENLFSGQYTNAILFYEFRAGSGHTLYRRNNFDGWRGKTAVVPVKPNTTYAVKVHDEPTNDVFRIGLMNEPPTFANSNLESFVVDDFVTEQRTYNKEHVFTTKADTNYALIYVSNDGTEPMLMVNEGSEFKAYQGAMYIPKQYLDSSLSTGSSGIQTDGKFTFAGNFNEYYSEPALENYYSNPTTLTPENYHAEFKKLIDKYSIASRTLLGKDDFGNNLYKYEIKPTEYYKGSYWNQNPGNEGQKLDSPKIMVTSGVHGRENNVSYAVYYLFKAILENPNNLDELDSLKTNLHLIAIPIASPSGFIDGTYENRAKMNINRDFPPYGTVTQGETKLIKKVIDENKDMAFFIDYHNMQARHDLIGYSLTDDEFFKYSTLAMYRNVGRHWQKKDSRFPQSIMHRWAYTVASNEGTVGRYVKDVLGIPSTLIEIPLSSQWVSEGAHGPVNTQMGVDILMNMIFACIRSKQ